MSTQVLRLRDVLSRTGLSRSQIYALAAKGEFPHPIKLSTRASGFEEAAVENWLRSRIDGCKYPTLPSSSASAPNPPERIP